MEMIIKKTIGNTVYTFVFAGDNLYEVITESQKLSFGDVTECGICKSNDLYLSAHLAQDKFKYHEVRCNNCRAELSFGTRQDDSNISYLQKNDNGTLRWKPFEQSQVPPQTNNINHEHRSKPANNKPVNNSNNKAANNKNKYSGKALNFATKIAVMDKDALEMFAETIRQESSFTPEEICYLRTEYARRMNILNAPAVMAS